jgi:hypothetical protein
VGRYATHVADSNRPVMIERNARHKSLFLH